MVFEHSLREQYGGRLGRLILLQLQQEDLVILSKLHLVVVNCFREVLGIRRVILERIEVVQTSHCDCENLSG